MSIYPFQPLMEDVELMGGKREVIVRFHPYLQGMRSKGKRRRGAPITITLALLFAISPAILTTQFGFGFSPILTGSMAPSANAGDLYFTKITKISTLALGDVIAINNPSTGLYYSHRIVEIRPLNGLLRIVTQGDANDLADRDPFMASPQGEVSKVILRIPYLGRPLVFINTDQGRQGAATMIVVANFLALIVFLFRKKIVATLIPERVYKELYAEERKSNEQYRLLLHSLQESLALEREQNEKVGSVR